MDYNVLYEGHRTLHDAEQLGAAIQKKRRKSLTQSELAKLLGAEQKWVLNLEAGNIRLKSA